MKKLTSKEWIAQIFKAKIVKKGGIVRRNKRNVEKYASMNALSVAVQLHGFHLIEIGEQCVVICNRGKIKMTIRQ